MESEELTELIGSDKELRKLIERRIQQFIRISTECLDLFVEKDVEYRDAISACGVLGASVEILSLGYRLQSLAIKNSTHGRDRAETIRKLAPDVLVYGAILMMMLEDENWDGD